MQLLPILALICSTLALAEPASQKFEHGVVDADHPIHARAVRPAILLHRRADNSTTSGPSTTDVTVTSTTTSVPTTTVTTDLTSTITQPPKTTKTTTRTKSSQSDVIVTVTGDDGQQSVVTSQTLVFVTETFVPEEEEKPTPTEPSEDVTLATSGAEVNAPGLGMWMGAGAVFLGAMLG